MADAPLKKDKADDYLLEMAAHTPWLKTLVERVVLLRDTPPDDFLENVYTGFLEANGLTDKKPVTSETKPKSHTTSSRKDFSLETLEHKSGVNLLKKGAKLPFHSNLTVVYGKNGSGKSGFVRILKRVAGSRTQEDIWQNVHDGRSQNNCEAIIKYKLGEAQKTFEWSGEHKVDPFSQISVFDGKCIPIYLNKGLGFSYQPYGFELFTAVSSALLDLQERLAGDIQQAEEDTPPIEDLFDPNTSVGQFVAGVGAHTKPEELKQIPAWNHRTQKELQTKNKERRDLQNLEQQAEILRNRLQKLNALEEIVLRAGQELSAPNIKIYLALIRRFNALKKKKVAKKGKTLEDYDIPEMNSNEWEQLIDAGEEYINHAEHDEYPEEDDHCIYCRQKLTKSAVKLIRLYRQLFEDEETTDLEDVETSLDEAIEDLEGSYVETLPYAKEDYDKVLTKKVITDAFQLLKAADALSQGIATAIKGKKLTKIQPIKLKGVAGAVRRAVQKVESDTAALIEAQKNLLKRSRELDQAISELQDVQKFDKHKAKVEKCIALEKWIEKAEAVRVRLNTKSITDLGKRAWDELVSASFQKRFKEEVENLNAPSVNLEFRGEYGSQMRQKSLAGLDGIDQFLSEGEQKAVALADFFTELSIEKETAPVVFDDPATSFDHDRKEKIAKRIVKESGSRQVVVFTHDLMFASYLHDQVEDTNGNIDASKASFHDLRAESKQAGLVTENYYAGSVKFDAYMQKVGNKVKELETMAGEPLADGIRTAYSMLRRAVEKAVEERIFGRVIVRWSDQIQMFNVPRATLSKEKLNEAKSLHEEFSRYIEAHNQSNEMVQHSPPDLQRLKDDVERTKAIAAKT